MVGSKTKNKQTGDIGESIACIFLERKGYRIVDTKVRASWCEIDIIAERENMIHFVEVKSVMCDGDFLFSDDKNQYRPEELVHEVKFRKIARFADFYMNKEQDQRDYQIDVIGVFLHKKQHKARCRMTENVFL